MESAACRNLLWWGAFDPEKACTTLDIARVRQRRVDPTIEVRVDGSDVVRLPLSQVAPGRYETRGLVDTTRPLWFATGDVPGSSDLTRVVAADPAAEYRFAGPDDAFLSAIARATGGTTNPSDDIRQVHLTTGTQRYPLAPWIWRPASRSGWPT
jgi:hypothetical protein